MKELPHILKFYWRGDVYEAHIQRYVDVAPLNTTPYPHLNLSMCGSCHIEPPFKFYALPYKTSGFVEPPPPRLEVETSGGNQEIYWDFETEQGQSLWLSSVMCITDSLL